jgi:hypothetical protein
VRHHIACEPIVNLEEGLPEESVERRGSKTADGEWARSTQMPVERRERPRLTARNHDVTASSCEICSEFFVATS